MTLVAIPPTALWVTEYGITGAGVNSMLIDAAGEKCASFIGASPRDGTIDKVAFRTAVVTTGATVAVQIEGLDGSGDPNGILFAAGASASVALVAGTDSNKIIEVTLSTPMPILRGDRFAIVIYWASPGVINVARYQSGVIAWSLPYTDAFNTGAWVHAASLCLGAVHFNDGTYANIGGLVPLDVQTIDGFQDSTNPDERGNKITVPFKCKVSGLWHIGASSLGAWTVRLYDSNSNVLASKVSGVGAIQAAGANPRRTVLDTEVTLNAGDVVRVSLIGTSASANTQLVNFTYPAGMAAAVAGGGATGFTARNNGGAWTDTANKIAAIGLILSAVDDGVPIETARGYAA